MKPRTPRVPRLRTVLLIVNLIILALPLGGIAYLRLYEGELVRQTETELIAQGALISSAYKEAILPMFSNPDYIDGYGNELPEKYADQWDERETYLPILPELDRFSDAVLSPAEDAEATGQVADRYAASAGEWILPMVKAAKKRNLAGVRVVDYNGIVVASSGTEYGQSLKSRAEVAMALSGTYESVMRKRSSDSPKPSVTSISRRARVRVFVAVPIVEKGRVLGAVVLSRTPLDIMKALYFKRKYLYSSAAFLLGMVVLVSIFISFTISRPVRGLISQAEAISKGDQDVVHPLDRPGTKEVALLSGALAEMARTLNERAVYIRDFASHVSHEFKSPIASIRGTAELLRDHMDQMALEEKERFIGMIDSDGKRLEKLVGRLMEMAKADVTRPGGQSAHLDKVVAELMKRYSESGFEVRIPGDINFKVKMAPEVLDSVLSSLLDNAKQHAGQGISVEIKAEKLISNKIEYAGITVADNGVGISKANADKIFDPFFTTGKESQSSGLGLPIALKLAKAHGGDICLVQSEKGASFLLTIPLADK